MERLHYTRHVSMAILIQHCTYYSITVILTIRTRYNYMYVTHVNIVSVLLYIMRFVRYVYTEKTIMYILNHNYKTTEHNYNTNNIIM